MKNTGDVVPRDEDPGIRTAPADPEGPDDFPLPFSARRALLASTALWTCLAVVSALQFHFGARFAGTDVPWTATLIQMVGWYLWAVLTLPIVWLARAFPLEREALTRSLPVHLVAGILAAVLHAALLASAHRWAGLLAGETWLESFWGYVRFRFAFAFLIYWAIVGVYYAIWNYQRLKDRSVAAARARREAAEARTALTRSRLQALRSQLHPHFLFNTLHSIASLMDEDVETARRLIARLSELLRTVLDTTEVREVELGAELELLEGYLEIERVRFGERLEVVLEIEQEAREALVPPFLLQPLVENAVRHGVSPLEEGGRVAVRARRSGERLLLEVGDTGRGWSPGEVREGVGLGNTRARLRHMYGSDHSFVLDASEGRGVWARIDIPFRPSSRGSEVDAGRDRRIAGSA